MVAYATRQTVQHLDVQLEVRNLEARPQFVHIVLARVGLVATEHQPTPLVAHVDVAVNHARDRHFRRDPGDWLSNEELVTGRHNLYARTGELADQPRPGAGGIDDRR